MPGAFCAQDFHCSRTPSHETSREFTDRSHRSQDGGLSTGLMSIENAAVRRAGRLAYRVACGAGLLASVPVPRGPVL